MAAPEVSAKSVRAKNVRRVASQLLAQLHLAAKVQQLYSGENDNVRKAFDALQARLEELLSFEPRLALHVEDGYLFANDVRLRVEAQAAQAHYWCLERFVESGIGALTIERDVKPIELRKLVPIFARAVWPEGGQAPPVPQELERAFVVHAKVVMRRSREVQSQDHDHAEISSGKLALALWRRVHRAATESCAAARDGGIVPLKKGRALVQVLIDAFLEDEAALVAATRTKCFAPEGTAPASPHQVYLESHIANTTVLAIGLGARVGLGRRQLLDLGAAALVADIGMALMPRSALEREGPLSPEERAALRLHPLRAAEAVLRADESARVNRLCAAAAAQHHPRGYAVGGIEVEPGLLASIISVADAYDAMTTDRPWRPALPHARALEELLSGKGGHRRPLVKVFANLLGLYPIGSCLELTSGETAIVVEQSKDPRLSGRPVVRVLIEPGGKPAATPRTIDLAERGPGGIFLRGVARMVDAGLGGGAASGVGAAEIAAIL